MYKVIFDDEATEDLKDIHPKNVQQILERIKDHLCYLPRQLGKRLKGNHKGFYSHRHGNYRIIYKISEREHTIIIYNIGHRLEVYDF